MRERLILSCLPCGWRKALIVGASYAPRCENCGHVDLEHYIARVSREELREIDRPGQTLKVPRPRLVIGSPA